MKAKQDFLWYKEDDIISASEDAENIKKWGALGLLKDIDAPRTASIKSTGLIDKVKDVVEDVLDDGKLNKSNKKKRKGWTR